MLQRGQQEGAELALLAVHAGQEVLGQQPQKELLGQVFGLVRVVSAAANVGVERIPIDAAEFCHRLGRAGRNAAVGGRQHQRPSRGGKARGVGSGHWLVFARA